MGSPCMLFLDWSTSFANSPSRDYDDKYSPIIKSFTISDVPPPKPKAPRLFSWAWFKSYRAPLPPRFQGPFPYNIVCVTSVPSSVNHSSVPFTGFTHPPTDSLPCLHQPCLSPIYYLVSSFPRACQAPRGRRVDRSATHSYIRTTRTRGRGHRRRYRR